MLHKSDILLFWFTFPWLLVRLNIAFYIYWPLVYLWACELYVHILFLLRSSLLILKIYIYIIKISPLFLASLICQLLFYNLQSN